MGVVNEDREILPHLNLFHSPRNRVNRFQARRYGFRFYPHTEGGSRSSQSIIDVKPTVELKGYGEGFARQHKLETHTGRALPDLLSRYLCPGLHAAAHH